MPSITFCQVKYCIIMVGLALYGYFNKKKVVSYNQSDLTLMIIIN